jgi:hypothetical protein
MKKTSYVWSLAVSLLIVAAVPAPNIAQTSPQGGMPAVNISNDFGYFLKNVDSGQVVNGLRNGQWTTMITEPGSTTPTRTTVALPTGKMGWGDVKISLALAQHSLGQQGIMQPTSEQLYAALTGGELASGNPATRGILQLRSEGMGWGQIAEEYGAKLGHLMGPINSGRQSAATAGTSAAMGKGIVNAGGQPIGSTDRDIVTRDRGMSGQQSKGTGIVSASGRSTGNSLSSPSHGYRGIVTGSGHSVGATSGIVTGGGLGHAYGMSGGGFGDSGVHGMGHHR